MTKKKQYISLLIVLTIIGLKLTAQSNCPNHENIIELDHNCNIVVENYEARERISLKPGFSFNASNGRFSARLNETLVLDLEYTDEIYVPDIEEVQIDTELAVGSIAGMHGVSPTGAATYTVPIGVPGGVAGLEPNISINYNSQSGSGLLGWGWHLAGTSAIVRVPQTEYYDGNITAIQLNNDDRFMLDGLRLLPKNGSYAGYGTNNFEYEKEITDFSNIKSIGAGNNMHFIVTTKDGIIIEYGVTEDSRLFTSGDNILAWNINKITDRNGNYITFTYDNSDEECVISYIEYTGNTNAGQEPTNKITFVYDKRSVDKNQMYISNGEFIKTEKILTKIIVRSNNSVLSKYEFNYFHDNIHTKLWEIKQYGINDEEINSTIVNWGEKGDELAKDIDYLPTISLPDPEEYTFIEQSVYADFTGNGKADRLVQIHYYHGLQYTPVKLELQLYQQESNSGTFEKLCDKVFEQESAMQYSWTTQLPNHKYFPSDFTGDLKNDILKVEKVRKFDDVNEQGRTNKYNSISVYSIEKDVINNFEFQQKHIYNNIEDKYRTTNEQWLASLGNPKKENLYITGDFTGDNTTNIIIFHQDITENGNCPPYAYKFTPILYNPYLSKKYHLTSNISQEDRCTLQKRLISTVEVEDELNAIYAVDFTGNGKDELMVGTVVSNLGIIYIYAIELDEANEIFSLNLIKTIQGLNIVDNKIQGFGDFNSDGKVDFMFGKEGEIAFNKGDAYVTEQPVTYLSSYTICDFEPEFIIGDFNGDGKTDFTVVSLHREEIHSSEFKWFLKFDVYYSTGLNDVAFVLGDTYICNDYIISSSTPCATESFGVKTIILKLYLKNSYVGDFSGYGNSGIYNSKMQKQYLFTTESDNKLLSSIQNGLGNKTQFEYQTITNTENYVNQSNINDEDYLKLLAPITVVTKTKQDNAYYDGPTDEEFTITEYSYEGSLFYKPKRSWIGFNKTSSLVNETILSEAVSEPIYDGLLMPITTKTEITNELISDAEFNYQILTPNSSNSQIIFPYQNQIIEKQYTGPSFVTSTTINNFNNNGNLDYSKTTNENSVDNNKIIVETDYVYVGAGDITTPHKPELTTTKTSYQNFDETTPEEDFETEMFYEYYSNGNLKTQTDNKTLIFTHYEDYNHYGLPQNITTNVPGKTARTKNFVYSPCGRFVLKETDDMDFSVEYKYHTRTNNLISTTDAFGHTTTYKYDNLNRLIETTDPLGRKTNKSYEWALSSGIDNAVFKITTTSQNRPERITYHDKLARNIRSETIGYNNQTVIVTNEFDRLGNLIRKSEPHYSSNQSPFYVEHEYNTGGYFFNKLHKTTNRNQVTQYDYGHNSSTITPPSGLAYTNNFDISGNVINSIFPENNSVSFVYGSHGKPIETMANGVSSAMNYNDLLQQESLTDANAGTIEYDYFADGMLKTQTDARGMVIEMQYDQFDRIEKMILDSGDGEIEYEYYTDGNAKEMLKSITAPVNETQYEYDNFQRLVKLSETIDNTEYEFEYIYDNKGRLIKEIYPNGFGIEYEYDNNGLITGVKELTTNQDIWNTTDYNALGQVNTINLRTGQIEYIYEPTYATLKEIKYDDELHLWYDFNPQTGNLRERGSYVNEHDIIEIFDYDDLNRLTEYSYRNISPNELAINKFGEYEIKYYSNGNIDSKSDVGKYVYLGDGPHAVSNIYPFLEPEEYIPGEDPFEDFIENVDDEQLIEYNSFNKATKITQGDYELEIFYGHDKQRRKSILKQGETTIYTRYYLGKYEKEIRGSTITEYYYIGGPMGNIAVYISENGEAPVLYYTLTDHLGSIVAIADEDGDILQEQRFDPWGVPKHYEWDDNYGWAEVEPITMLFRGYTGHEMLPEFGLINMNGRLYDPVIARVLSPDNYVQNPYNPQNYNRYSYCYNNPLVYVDPSGESVILFTILAGAAMNAVMQATAENIHSWGDLGLAYGIGAVAGMASLGTGLLAAKAVGSLGFISNAIIGGASGYTGGFITGTGNALAGGASFSDAVYAGRRSGRIGALSGALISGTIGGVQAKRLGLNPITGKGTIINEMNLMTPLPFEAGEPTGITNHHELTEHTYNNYPGSEEYVQGVFKGTYGNPNASYNGYSVENNQLVGPNGAVHGVTISSKEKLFSGIISQITISPNMVTSSNNLHAVLGHELIHAYHVYTGLMVRYGSDFSEYYASKFSASISHSTQLGIQLELQRFNYSWPPLNHSLVYPNWVPYF